MAFNLKKAHQKTSFGAKPQESSESQELTCIVSRFIFKDEESGFFVFSAEIAEGHKNASAVVNGKSFVGRKFIVVGTSLIMTQTIVEGQEIDVWGSFEVGKEPGSIQFSATAIQEKIPTKPKAIELFLSSGKIYGIGAKIAKRIVNEFGPQTIHTLDNTPDLLLNVEGISKKKLEMIKQSWAEWRAIYDIVATMRLYGIGDAAGVKIFSHFKENSLHIIKNEPYDLTEVTAIGFKTADKIAQQTGKSPVDEKRIEKCILYKLEEISDSGSTAFPKNELALKTNELLQIDIELVQNKIEQLIESGALIQKDVAIKIFKDKNKNVFEYKNISVVAHSKIHNTEVKIAKELKRLSDFENNDLFSDENKINKFLKVNPFKLDDSQLAAAKTILSSKVAILTGGPGTGKTHTIKSLLSYFDGVNVNAVLLTADEDEEDNSTSGLNSVLSAPTGRAAKRMEESTKKNSSTMHRLLGFKEGQFIYNESNKLQGDVFILDESSMIDIWLLVAFLKALPSSARLIFVGDVDQLPSVGAGKVLKDMIESGCISVARLNVIHRQAMNSNIIVASHAIIHRQMPPLHSFDSDSDFVFIEEKQKENIYDRIEDVVNTLLSNGVKHDDIQILSPKKDGDVGTGNLNNGLRALLNPKYVNYTNMDSKFFPGDRVMQFKNNKDLDIFNGDIGKVDFIDEDAALLNVVFDGRDIEIGGQDINNLKLSYAITIHKSQGSDYPFVIIPMSSSHTFMWDVNLLYTAVTRGKKRVILVGEKKTLLMAVSSFKQTERITGLKEEIINIFSDPKPEVEVNNVQDVFLHLKM